MGEYRATLNMPGLGINKVGTFEDDDDATRRLVMWGHLVPVDDVALAAAKMHHEKPLAHPANDRDAIIAALKAARAKADEAGGAEVSQVSTATTVETEPGVEAEVEVEAPAIEKPDGRPVPRPSTNTQKKPSSGIQRKGRR